MIYTFILLVRRIVLFTLVATLLPAVGNAQAIASNFQELRFRVEPGDTIYITDRNDRETAAEIVELSGSALTVRISGVPRALAEQDVRRIRRRLPDPLWTGAIIGFGIGAGLGTGVASISESCSSDGGAACWAPVVVYGLISAGVGLGIDALINGPRVIYAPWQQIGAMAAGADGVGHHKGRNDEGSVLMTWTESVLMRPSLLAALLALLLAAPAFGQTCDEVAPPHVAPPGNWGQAVVAREGTRLMFTLPTRSPSLGARQQPRRERGWIGRHPVLFGTLVGFGGGFLIGYLGGDDGLFDDFTAEFNGLVLGGVGAGVGAVSGAVLAR